MKSPASVASAEDFSDVLRCDIVYLNDFNAMVLDLMDYSTEFSTAVQVEDRSSDTLVSLIFDKWITRFGAPKNILTDTEAGFTSDEFIESRERFDVISLTTSPYVPTGKEARRNSILEGAMLPVR